MGRVLINVDFNGRMVKTLVDTGSLNCYVERKILPETVHIGERVPLRAGLGGHIVTIQDECLSVGKIEGLEFSTDAYIVDEPGRLEPEGIEFEFLLGARALEKYGIKVDPRAGTLDLEGLRRREFTEF